MQGLVSKRLSNLLPLDFTRAPAQIFYMSGRNFSFGPKKVGSNDNLIDEKREFKKYGMKRRFYDHLPLIERQLPENLYRKGLTKTDLEGYDDIVKQALSLNNASITEITKSRIQEIVKIFGQHSMDVGNQAIQTAVHCEKVVSLLNHLRENHKDVAALIKLQRALTQRRRALFYLKNNQFLDYVHILRVYGLTDLKSERGEGIHKENFKCKNFK